jgi:hypothetical protein
VFAAASAGITAANWVEIPVPLRVMFQSEKEMFPDTGRSASTIARNAGAAALPLTGPAKMVLAEAEEGTEPPTLGGDETTCPKLHAHTTNRMAFIELEPLVV